MLANRLSHFLRAAAFAALLALAGCQSAPVQEMSDARQAINVAKEAGAEQHAPDYLRAAMTYLERAEGFLSQRQYKQARREAVKAKASAMDALRPDTNHIPAEPVNTVVK